MGPSYDQKERVSNACNDEDTIQPPAQDVATVDSRRLEGLSVFQCVLTSTAKNESKLVG
jgi:hypothetical protein